MNLERGIVKTVNLDNEQLLMIESPRGNCVCVIHRGVCLIGSRPERSTDGPGGASSRSWWPSGAWLRGLISRHRASTATAHWQGLRAVRWLQA